MKFLVIRQSPTPSATGSSTTHTCASWAGHRSEETKLYRLKPNQPDPVTRRFAPIAFKCIGTPAQVQAERAFKLVGIRSVEWHSTRHEKCSHFCEAHVAWPTQNARRAR